LSKQIGSTHPQHKLGLSIARRSVAADSGTLSVRDQPGVGCVFTLRIPIAF